MSEYKQKYKFAFDLPKLSDLLKAGVHFGHQTKRWNPQMKKYIFGSRGGIHIIDVSYTFPMLEEALNFLRTVSAKGPVIFVGTKRQARDLVENVAIESGSFFVVDKWPGGLLTNSKMVNMNLKKLNKLEKDLREGVEDRTKQEIAWMKAEWERLDRSYRGVKTMTSLPTAMIVVDTKLQSGPISEARKLGIPIVGLLDTNSDPDMVDYGVIANDDATKSLELFIDLFKKAVMEGNKGQGIKHDLEDLSTKEVKRISKHVSVNVDKSKLEKAEEVLVAQAEARKEAAAEKPKVRIVKREEAEEREEVKAKKPSEKKATKKVELSEKIQKLLDGAKVKTEDLADMTDEQITDIKGIGPKALEEIRKSI